MSPYRFIERQRGRYAVRALCQVLGVAPSAYYIWRQQRQRPAPTWERAVCRAFARHACRYGTRRLRAELQAAGYQVGRHRIRQVLRKVVGRDLRETIPADLVSEALRRALAVRQPAAGPLVHSDQGSQYTATRFRDLLADYGAAQSMSRRGNCYNNAQAESFWSRLKTELLDGGSFAGLEEARLEVAHYIAYYNDERRHSSLAYQSPNHFETHFQPMPQLCPA